MQPRGSRCKYCSAFCKCSSQKPWENVCLWFPSGNTNIVVLAVKLLQEFNDQGFILNGKGSNKEHYKLGDFEIDIESTIAPLDLHVTMCSRFSGNKNKNVGS